MSADDYRVEAEQNLQLALADESGYRHLSTENLIALAQLNATLYAAEQQRLANIIAVASDPHSRSSKLDDIRIGLAGEVWEGLGLS